MFAGPMHVLVLANLQAQIAFLGEQRVVVLQSEPKERKRFDGRTSPHHHFCAPLRQQVERGELLKDPDRIGSAQDGDRAGQTDAPRSCRCRGQNECRRRIQY